MADPQVSRHGDFSVPGTTRAVSWVGTTNSSRLRWTDLCQEGRTLRPGLEGRGYKSLLLLQRVILAFELWFLERILHHLLKDCGSENVLNRHGTIGR